MKVADGGRTDTPREELGQLWEELDDLGDALDDEDAVEVALSSEPDTPS